MTEEINIIPDNTLLDDLIADPKIKRLILTTILVSIKGMTGVARSATSSAIASLSAYETYLVKTYNRVSTIKTFVDPSKPVSLLDHYTETKLSINYGDQSINEADLRALLQDGSKIVVSALAGYGKSVLMRFLALSFYENPAGRIPIFIELRDLNRTKNPDIISYIHSTYKQNSTLARDVFEKAMKAGSFVFFFDGYDELNYEHRKDVEDQILSLSLNFSQCPLIVSSRPDDKFNSWEKFVTYRIEPMALVQVRDLIKKLDYGSGVKKRFLDKLTTQMYQRHKSFLSTPLLATLMMLTYENNANIPEKMHLFYLRAYETLFEKHDTYKEQYERSRKSGMRIDQFATFFSIFCFNSYLEERFEFSKVEILKYIEEAITYSGIDAKIEDVLFDLTESVCLLQLEGQSYSFVHRSFQEYFTAYFLSNCPSDFRDEFLDEYKLRPWDSCLPMLFDMSKDVIEADWVRPRIDAYLTYLKSSKKSLSASVFLAHYKGMDLLNTRDNRHKWHNFRDGPFLNLFKCLHQFYKSDFDDNVNYLLVDQVDEFNQLICAQRGIQHCNYLEYSEIEGEVNYIEFDNDIKIPIRSILVLTLLKEHQQVLKISRNIDDRKVAQTALINKMRRSTKITSV